MSDWTPSELMVIVAARHLSGASNCFVGVGLPNLACNLARQTTAPGLELIYESGILGAAPGRLPLSIGDPSIVSGARMVTSMHDVFAYFLQRGLVDVAFLGAAQIDRRGSVNTTVVGSYDSPTVRLPGSGGACEIALNAGRVFFILRQSSRSFVERLDFVTSPGHVGEVRGTDRRGPALVVTQLGTYEFHDGEMTLVSLHPGCTLDQVRDATGWELKVSDSLETAEAPTPGEIEKVRALDPSRIYLG